MVGSAGATIMLSSWASSMAMTRPLIVTSIWRWLNPSPAAPFVGLRHDRPPLISLPTG